MLVVDMKVKGVVGVCRIVWMAAQRFLPGDDFAHVLDDGLALRKVRARKNPLAMHTGTSGLNTSARDRCGGNFWHQDFSVNLNTYARARARARERRIVVVCFLRKSNE